MALRPNIRDLNDYLSKLNPSDVKASDALRIAINTAFRYIPVLKKTDTEMNYDSKLLELQRYVATLAKSTRSGGKRKTRHRRQTGGANPVFILYAIFFVLLVYAKLQRAAPQDVISENEKQNAELLVAQASYNPAILELLQAGYQTFSPARKAYLDSICMRDYGTHLMNFILQPMPDHPFYEYEIAGNFENENYIEAALDWEQAYIARHERDLELPDVDPSFIPEGYGPPTNRFTTANAAHVGTYNIPAGSYNLITFEEVANGNEMVELHGIPMHYYKRETINDLLASAGQWPKRNPLTRKSIRTPSNMKRYTAKVSAAATKP